MAKKMIVLGLDCATPQLVFDRWLDELPNIKSILQNGVYGELKSTVPPITVPAWLTMVSGKSPGSLGIYGLRNRKDSSYSDLEFTNSKKIQTDLIWDILSKNDYRSIIIGVPHTYPPTEINGCMISGFMTPDTDLPFTFPESLKSELAEAVGDYRVDVDGFRSKNEEEVLNEIYELSENRFKVTEYLMGNKLWDFLMMVEMGLDRLHHRFWKYIDEKHPEYESGNEYESEVKNYYIYLDKKIGEILKRVDNQTNVMVVSDHGAKAMQRGFCINEWLIDQGYLKVHDYPDSVTPLENENIDWPNTTAWGYGGYYSRIFLNVEGREPQGKIPASKYEETQDKLKHELETIGDKKGNNIGNKVLKPKEVYSTVKGIPPDLIVYPGDLNWRSIGTIGYNKIFTAKNDTGVDYANHSRKGIFALKGPNISANNFELNELDIKDVAPTILSVFDQPVPEDFEGTPIETVKTSRS